jgi:hypothetical protein
MGAAGLPSVNGALSSPASLLAPEGAISPGTSLRRCMMKVRVCLCIVFVALAGFLLAADPPNKDRGAKSAGEETYAKVELKGQLSLQGRPGGSGPSLSVQRDQYDLDLSLQKELQGDGLRKLDNSIIIVTGTLEVHPLGERGLPRVLVSSVRVDASRVGSVQ